MKQWTENFLLLRCLLVLHWSGFYLLPSSRVIPEINKYSEISIKLESQRSWEPTGCAASQLQRVRLDFSFCNTEPCGYRLRLFFSEVTFSGCFKVASVFFSFLRSFLQSLGQCQDDVASGSVSAGDCGCGEPCVGCARAAPQPSLPGGCFRDAEQQGFRDPTRERAQGILEN